MGDKKIEKKAIKDSLETKQKIDEQEKQIFKRILVKFRQYWRILALLMFSYIVCFLIWASMAEAVRKYLEGKGLDGNTLWVVILAAILQGLLFTMDGFVTSLLKSPFSQMNQNINHSGLITEKEKDYLTFRNTNSNENCKETLKKFGILTITTELVRVFIRNSEVTKGKETYLYEYLMIISYLIPLFFVFADIWRVHRMLKKIEKRQKKSEKSFTLTHGKKGN